MPTNNKSKKLCCSFCGRSETEVELLIPAALLICGFVRWTRRRRL